MLGTCLFCDKPLVQKLKGRNKKYCDAECRARYWDERDPNNGYDVVAEYERRKKEEE